MSKLPSQNFLDNMAAIPGLYNPLPPIPVLHPELKDKLRTRMIKTLVFVRKNIKTTFFQESDHLANLRRSISSSGEGQNIDNDEQLLKQFTVHVALSTYDTYRPFINRFFPGSNNPISSSPCSVDAVKDLLSPGLPILLAQTSATSNPEFKFFPKYYLPMAQNKDGAHSSNGGLTTCGIYSLRTCGRVILDAVDEAKEVKDIPIVTFSTGYMRIAQGITLENEKEMAERKLPSNVAPLAVGLLPSYKAMCFTYLFFAVLDDKLSYMAATFSTHLSDSLDILMEHWDLVIDSIEKGTLPEVFELGKYKSCLQKHIKPNPERAQGLRSITIGQQGWLKQVWPRLKIVRANCSGIQFSAPVPNLRHQFGPEVDLITGMLLATESAMGRAYSASDLNLYKLSPLEYFEFLDIEKPETSDHLSPCWEVETGKQYEIVTTAWNGGLWRYRMGDIVEIVGFVPDDGLPLMRFIERRGVKIRIATEIITETQLAEAIHSESVENILGPIAEFTTVLDVRKSTKAYGFFVELRTNTAKATQPSFAAVTALQAHFSSTNAGYQRWVDEGLMGKPTIRIVASGTFQAYRDWKVGQRGVSAGQVKAPVAISPEDVEAANFFKERVSYEV